MNNGTRSRCGVLKTTLMAGAIFMAAVLFGNLATQYLPHNLLIPLLKFSIAIVGVVWFFSLTVYNKLSDITELSGLDFRQHRNIEIEIRARLHGFWLRAIYLGLLALTMYTPSILKEASITIPNWLIGLAFGALALAFFSLKPLWVELEEIRELKSYVKEIERCEKEKTEQLKKLNEGLKTEWQPDSSLDGFRNVPRLDTAPVEPQENKVDH